MNSVPRFMVVLCASLLFSLPLTAGVDLSSGVSLEIPTGDLGEYNFGAVGLGVTARASTNIRKSVRVFVQCDYTDLGVETQLIPRDNIISFAELHTAADAYIFSVMPGITLQADLEAAIPYLSLSGGLNHFHSVSRIFSPDISELTRHLQASATSWCVGIGLGLQSMIWAPVKAGNRKGVNAVYVDLRFDFHTGGNFEFLDWRSVYYKSGELNYQVKETGSGMVMISAGIGVSF